MCHGQSLLIFFATMRTQKFHKSESPVKNLEKEEDIVNEHLW